MLSFFCFSKLGAPLFRFFFVSFWNVHFRWKSMSSYLGRSCTPTTKTSIFTKIIFSPKNPCFSCGWVYMTSRDRKTWIFTGNGRFRTRQKKPEKESSPLWKKIKNRAFWKSRKITFFFANRNFRTGHDQNQRARVGFHLYNQPTQWNLVSPPIPLPLDKKYSFYEENKPKCIQTFRINRTHE